MTQSDFAYISCGSTSDELKERIRTTLEEEGLDVSDLSRGGLVVEQ